MAARSGIELCTGLLSDSASVLPLVRPGGLILAHNTTNTGRQMPDYFAAVTAAKKTIAGQHNKFNDTPAVSTDWIKSHTSVGGATRAGRGERVRGGAQGATCG